MTRPLLYLDDDISMRDRGYVERHHPGAALLHYVDPAKGLLAEDFAVLREWGISFTGSAGSAA